MELRGICQDRRLVMVTNTWKFQAVRLSDLSEKCSISEKGTAMQRGRFIFFAAVKAANLLHGGIV